jgi:hypothetical protein
MGFKQTRGVFEARRLHCILLLFTLLLGAERAVAFSVVVGKQHPFLFVDKSELENAKSNVFVRKLPRSVAAYNKLKSRADSALSISVPYSYGYEENSAERYGAAGVRLATAYVMTGDTRYAEKAKAILIGLARGFNPSSSTVSYNYYLGFSRNIPMYAHIYDLLYNYLTSSERQLVANNLLRPAANALKQYVYDPKSNIRSWHSLAVGCIGFVLEDSTLTKHAVESTGGFKYQVANCIEADGLWWEATMQYHFFALSPLALLAEAAAHSGSSENLYTYTSPNGRSLKMMFDAPIQLADAALFLPGNNDSKGDRTLLDQEVYELANKRYSDPQYDWVISKAPSPLYGYVLLEGYTIFGQPCALVTPPSPDRMIHAGVGWATLREDTTPRFWGSQSIMVMLDYGPHGGSHGHADKLNLDITAFGKRLAVDRSNYSYSESMHLTWDRQTLAHNTVVVDKKSQPGAESMFDSAGVTGRLEFSDENAGIKVVQASADSAYGIGYRRLVALPTGYVIDIFRLTSSTIRTYDWVMRAEDSDGVLQSSLSGFTAASLGASSDGYQHVTNVQKATTSGTWNVTWQNGASLRVTIIDRPGTEVFKAVSPGGANGKNIPMVLARRTASSTTFIAVEEPFLTSPVLQVQPFVDTVSAAGVIVQGPAFRDLFVAAHGATASLKAVNPADALEYVNLAGKYAYIRINGSSISAYGSLTGFRVKASGITKVSLNGASVPFTSSGGYVKFGS